MWAVEKCSSFTKESYGKSSNHSSLSSVPCRIPVWRRKLFNCERCSILLVLPIQKIEIIIGFSICYDFSVALTFFDAAAGRWICTFRVEWESPLVCMCSELRVASKHMQQNIHILIIYTVQTLAKHEMERKREKVASWLRVRSNGLVKIRSKIACSSIIFLFGFHLIVSSMICMFSVCHARWKVSNEWK